jgi:hypothetical protein
MKSITFELIGGNNMIIFTLLGTIALVALVVAIVAIACFGATFLLVFGDLIVFILIMIVIAKVIKRFKKH